MQTIATRFTWLITQLRTAIGVFVAREARVQPAVWLGGQAFVPLIPPARLPKLNDEVWGLVWNRLGRLAARFQRLFDRWRTNTLPARPLPRATRPAPATAPQHPRLPRQIGWLNQRIPESAPPSGQLEAALHDPDMRAFVEAAPQAGRLLRPLCRALGVALPEWLRLPPRPRPPRAPRPPRPRRPSLTDPELRLPRNIIAAARAWRKFG